MKSSLRTITDVLARRKANLRLSSMIIIFAVVFSIIILRLVQIQVTENEKYEQAALRNIRRSIPTPPVRAAIEDMNGETLAVDTPQFRLVKILTNGRWEQELIDFERASQLVEHDDGAGNYVEAIPRREYTTGATSAHILGYVGEISKEELKQWSSRGYRQGDRVGKSGLERQYELDITGESGKRVLTVDSLGNFLSTEGSIPALGGDTLHTTLDVRLQTAAYNALAEKGVPGAVIVMDSQTGAIRAMATYPSFDNNLAIGGFDVKTWNSLQSDPMHPLINRAISVSIPLGSVFKLVVAAAALEEKTITKKTSFYCPGHFRLGNRVFKCWELRGHGSMQLEDAIAHSCDVYFYNTGLQLGVTNIRKYAKMLGLGRKTGLDLPGESIGLLPDPEWKKKFRGQPWYEGDTVNTSIGQGFIQVSPLQALVMTNVFATRGRVVTPHLVQTGQPQYEIAQLSPETIEIVRNGMLKTVTQGTAVRMSRFSISSAGKTGTAEDPPRENPHAWFSGFAPYDKPVLSYVVFVENGGHGSSDALPLALKVMETALEAGYFDKPDSGPSSAASLN